VSTKAISGCDECGWTSKPTTPSYADKAYRLHSCERKRRDDAATARNRARAAAVDRTPKPCLHKRANHQHGTYACYVLDFCRCLPCASANSNYEVERVRRIAYGRPAYVAAEPVRAHVRALMAAGLGWKRVAARAEVSSGVMTKLLYGETARGMPPSRRIRPDTAARLLAVTADRLADGAVIDGTGTRRRLQALVVAGWPQARLAERLGMNPANFGPLILGQRDPTVATARRMAALYDELWNTAPAPANRWELGASNRARRHALARGWAPALAWDEDTIDDPAALPNLAGQHDEATVLAWLAVHSEPDGATHADRVEVLRRLMDLGFTTLRQQTALTGLSESAITNARIAVYRARAESERHTA
jgi:transcriptional regulator with XRE-family HTH domain